jgi:hypothetical protein
VLDPHQRKTLVLSLVFLTAVIVLVSSLQIFGQQQNPTTPGIARQFVPNRVLVRFRNPQRADAVLSRFRPTIEKQVGSLGVLVLRLPDGESEDAVVFELNRSPDVDFAELDRVIPPAQTASDPYFGSEWHLPKINAPTAWDTTVGNAGLVMAVLDTGVESSHPDLAPRLVPGWNVYDNNSNTEDVYGHGTNVAGTIGAVTNNGAGVSSVTWSGSVMPIRISDPNGYASYSTAASGLTWAADHGARVANISYEVSDSATVATAAQYFQDHGGVVTISAGNEGTFIASPDNPYVLTVSATDDQDATASWSNSGNIIDVAAPGVSIYTTFYGAAYGANSGTSFSAPIVAGVAALVFAINPNFSGGQVQSIIKNSAADLGAAGWDPQYGYGRVDANAAVNLALNSTVADTTPPVVSFISPQNGDTVSGTITVQVNATDNVAVASVSLAVDGNNIGSDTTSPYTFVLDTTQFVNGSHTLTANAVDSSGNTATASITVAVNNVADSTPPVTTITSPQNGASVEGIVTIAASATDNVGVVQMQLFVDGVLKASSASSPITNRWNTRHTAAGSHVITAKAYDAAGNVGVASITVNR